MKRADYYWVALFGVLCVGFYLLVEYTINGAIFSGFPLDDSWIHAQFAHNLAAGNGLSYSGTEQTPGETSPLWAVLIAIVFKIFGEPHPVLEIRCASIAAYLLAGMMTSSAVYKATRSRLYGILAGISVLSTADMIWTSSAGMETALCALITIAAFWSYLCDEKHLSMRTGALFGLASLARPEITLLYAFALFDVVESKQPLDNFPRWIVKSFSMLVAQWRTILAFFLLASPYMVFCLLTTRQLFPNTYYSKDGGVHLSYITHFYFTLFSANPVLFILACVGVYTAARNSKIHRKKLFIAFFVIFPFICSFASAYIQFRRYFTFFLPILLPSAMVGMGAIYERIAHTNLKRIYVAVTIAAIFGFSVISNAFGIYPLNYADGKAWSGAEYTAWSIHNINEQQASIGRWIDATLPPQTTVAVNDVGAIGYLSHRRLVDLCGLVSNDVTRFFKKYKNATIVKKHLLEYLKLERKPDYVIIYETWYPGWSSQLPVVDSFNVIAKNNVICGWDTMTVLKMDWSRPQIPDSIAKSGY